MRVGRGDTDVSGILFVVRLGNALQRRNMNEGRSRLVIDYGLWSRSQMRVGCGNTSLLVMVLGNFEAPQVNSNSGNTDEGRGRLLIDYGFVDPLAVEGRPQ